MKRARGGGGGDGGVTIGHLESLHMIKSNICMILQGVTNSMSCDPGLKKRRRNSRMFGLADGSPGLTNAI